MMKKMINEKKNKKKPPHRRNILNVGTGISVKRRGGVKLVLWARNSPSKYIPNYTKLAFFFFI
jgi:hypothetical protein